MPSLSGGHPPQRQVVLQYQATVGPFVTVHPVEADRPGVPSGGSIAYRPTLTQYMSLAGPMGVFLTPFLGSGWQSTNSQPLPLPPYLRPRPAWFGPHYVPDTTEPVTALSWQGAYPNWLSRPQPTREGGAVVDFSAALPFQDPTRFGWRGSYPDQLLRPGLLAGSQRFLALETPVQYPIPETSWNPIAPAWLRARLGLAVGDLTGAVQPIDPLPNDESPDLAWQGWQPERLWRAARVVEFPAYSQPPRLTPFVPDFVGGLAVYPDQLLRRALPAAAYPTGPDRFDIVIPDLRRDWAPIYPDWLRRQAVREYPGQATWPPTGNLAPFPTDWQPVRPDFLSRRRLRPVHATGAFPFSSSHTILVGELMAWEPDKLYIPIRRQLLSALAQTILLDPAVPGEGIDCIEFVWFMGTRPRLQRLQATRTRLLYMTATTTQGTQFQWC